MAKNRQYERMDMTNVELQSGGCVCKKVRYSISGIPLRVTVCHCTWCQRRTGSAFGVELVFKLEQVNFFNETISTYRHVSDVSGRWLDQHFCNTCGTNIGLTLEAVPSIRSISVGSLDNQNWSELEGLDCRHVYIRSARRWSVIPDDVAQYEEHFRV